MLEDQAQTRVPELVPFRYGRMLASPFTFYRGAAAIMAMDLADSPQSGLRAQLCGDAHLSNFGVFAAPDRRLIFDLNDFDETLPGPWEWDVKRLAASVAIAGRSLDFKPKEYQRAVRAAASEYRSAMRRFAGMRNLDIWYSRINVDDLFEQMRRMADAKRVKAAEKDVEKAKRKDSQRALERLAHVVDGELRIISDPPLLVPVEELAGGEDVEETMREVLGSYTASLRGDYRHLLEEYRYVDLARKVVGVGSVGTRAWVVLLCGRDDDDPLFLQAKEAEASVLEPYAGASEFDNHGERVVQGQWLMQATSDILLGWLQSPGLDGTPRDFYVRQLWDWKRSIDVDTMLPDGLAIYGGVCGVALARAHACSGDPIAIAAYLGKGGGFDEAIVEFADRYADQNDADYALVAEAARSGRIEADASL